MQYIDQFLALVNGIKIVTILILIAVDLLLGIIIAIKEGTFQLSKIANFLNTSVLYFLGGYLLLGVAATAEPQWGAPMLIAAWLALDGTMVGFILAKLKKLGLPVPDKLT
jgi:hypothetical protein